MLLHLGDAKSSKNFTCIVLTEQKLRRYQVCQSRQNLKQQRQAIVQVFEGTSNIDNKLGTQMGSFYQA